MKKILYSSLIFAASVLLPATGIAQGIYQLWGTTPKGGTDDYGSLFRTDGHGKNIQTLYSFPKDHPGAAPMYNQLTGYNGKLYAMTSAGGADNLGVLFEWDPVTNIYIKKVDFDLTKGTQPQGSLVIWNDKLYGMTSGGGANNKGVIFEWDPATNIYTKKYDFDGATGSSPFGSLAVQGNKLYGMTHAGGVNDKGVIFEWDPVANTYLKKHDFDGTDGSNPYGDLVLHAGKFYGMTNTGGTNDKGVIFEWDPAMADYSKKVDFTGANGANPFGKMVFVNDKFYGTTTNGGGIGNYGVIFEWEPVTNNYIMRYDLEGSDGRGNHGIHPYGNFLVYGGKFYTMMSDRGSGTFTSGSLYEWDPVTNGHIVKYYSYNFTGDFDRTQNGERPFSSLTLMGGKMYGMTSGGGSTYNGVIFEWDPAGAGTYTKKINFNGAGNGFFPQSLVAQNNHLYGLADGGVNGLGVIFDWDLLTGQFSKTKDVDVTNGRKPFGIPVKYNNKFYTVSGPEISRPGRAPNLDWHIAEWDPVNNVYSSLKKFEQNARPTGDLAESGGKFYGTINGGSGNIFDWDPISNVITTLFSFGVEFNNTDDLTGRTPGIGLTEHAGKLFGLTTGGGINDAGVIYEWDITAKTFTKRFDFAGAEGSKPEGSLLLLNGKFWGIASAGGVNGLGVIFEWDPATNAYNKRHDFTSTEGKPVSSLSVNNGNLYGMTGNGGSSNMGIIFEYDPDSNQFSKKSEFNGANGQGITNRSNLVALPAKAAVGIPGNCVPVSSIIINDDNNNSWVPIIDNDGFAIAEIKANGNNLGIVNTSLYVNNSTIREDDARRLYLDRNITITPQFQPSTPVDIRLYIRGTEFETIKAAVNSIGEPSNIEAINELGIFKNDDNCGSNIIRKASPVVNTGAAWETDYVLSATIGKFSTFYFASKANVALPLTLLEFSGRLQNNNALLNWKTENEINTSEFKIERSIDAIQYKPLGTVAAANRAGIHNYNFTDPAINTLGSQIVYYRLKQYDIDGQFIYSKIVMLSLDNENTIVRLYPNPVNNELKLSISSLLRDDIKLKIMDAAGRTISLQTKQVATGSNSITIDLTKMATGVYYLSIQGKAINKWIQFVKQ